MQSYEHHIVHESLEMRHPYIQDPFTNEIDPAQVSSAIAVQLCADAFCPDFVRRLRRRCSIG